MAKKEPIIVYWSPYAKLDRLSYINMLCEPPKKVFSIMGRPLPESGHNPASIHACRGIQDLLRNTYTVTAPITSTATLAGSIHDPLVTASEQVWLKRAGSMQGVYSIDYDFSWVFFCEEPVNIRVTPPYLNKTSVDATGYLTSGSFKMNEWFRPINCSYNLWPGATSITITEGEPLMYIEFETIDERPVILKQFELTESLDNLIADSLVKFKLIKPFSSLEDVYERFTRSNRHKMALKAIKESVLE
jgi:hypothetical protein